MDNINELKNRYCFLYENAPLILACFTNGFSLLGHVLGNDNYLKLRDEVKKQMGFKETSKCYNLRESHDFIYLMEEAFLGDKKIEDTLKIVGLSNEILKRVLFGISAFVSFDIVSMSFPFAYHFVCFTSTRKERLL